MTVAHKYGHHNLVDLLATLSFCASCTESTTYRENAATAQGVDLNDEIVKTFMQYQADNIDHASKTLESSGTVHVMGQMVTFTPAIKARQCIPYVKVNMDDLKKVLCVYLLRQKNPKTVQENTKLSKFSLDDLNCKLDILWQV